VVGGTVGRGACVVATVCGGDVDDGDDLDEPEPDDELEPDDERDDREDELEPEAAELG